MSDLVARLRAQAEAILSEWDGDEVLVTMPTVLVREHEVALREAADRIEELTELVREGIRSDEHATAEDVDRRFLRWAESARALLAPSTEGEE